MSVKSTQRLKPQHTIRETARLMTERGYPMSRARVLQLEQRAFKKLRKGLESIAIDLGVIESEEA